MPRVHERVAADVDSEEEAELRRGEDGMGEAAHEDGAAANEEGEAPLGEDMTAAQLKSRKKQPKEKRKDSTGGAYDSTAGKWWPLFCKAVGWDKDEMMCWLDDNGTPRDGRLRALFVWLFEQEAAKGKAMTKGIYKPMLAWAQSELNRQLRARMLCELPDYVGKLPGIKQLKLPPRALPRALPRATGLHDHRGLRALGTVPCRCAWTWLGL